MIYEINLMPPTGGTTRNYTIWDYATTKQAKEEERMAQRRKQGKGK